MARNSIRTDRTRRSSLLSSVRETAQGLRAAGIMNDQTLRKFCAFRGARTAHGRLKRTA